MLAVLALLLIALAIWAALATGRDASSVPDDAAWRQAAQLVRQEHQQGDLITFAPEWIDPVGRMHLGDLISLDDAARMDSARFARVWVLAIRGADSPEVASEQPAFERTVGGSRGVTVRRYDRAPAVILDDAVRALPRARAEGQLAGGPQAVLAEVGFSPRRCVQVVPTAGGAATITFPQFLLGAELVGYVGLADVFTRRDIREPGELEIIVDGRPLAKAVAGVDDGWVRFAAKTTPGPVEVRVIARAPSPRAHQRQLCFAMESRR
jgi:hypothetical protein